MAASSSTDHMWLFEKNELHRLSDQPEWIAESVNVFTGNFTCNADKEKLVDVVMALYSFTIACGRYSSEEATSNQTPSTDRVAPHPATAAATSEGQLWLSALIDRNRKHIFPAEWFGDSIEILEVEIQKALEGKTSDIFSSVAFDRLLRARQELCRLHGADLPTPILEQFGARIEAVRAAAKVNTQGNKLVPPGDAGKNLGRGKTFNNLFQRKGKEVRKSKEGMGATEYTQVISMDVEATPPSKVE